MSDSFQEVLKQILTLAGWQVNGVNQAVVAVPVRGIVPEVPAENLAWKTFLSWVESNGL